MTLGNWKQAHGCAKGANRRGLIISFGPSVIPLRDLMKKIFTFSDGHKDELQVLRMISSQETSIQGGMQPRLKLHLQENNRTLSCLWWLATCNVVVESKDLEISVWTRGNLGFIVLIPLLG